VGERGWEGGKSWGLGAPRPSKAAVDAGSPRGDDVGITGGG